MVLILWQMIFVKHFFHLQWILCNVISLLSMWLHLCKWYKRRSKNLMKQRFIYCRMTTAEVNEWCFSSFFFLKKKNWTKLFEMKFIWFSLFFCFTLKDMSDFIYSSIQSKLLIHLKLTISLGIYLQKCKNPWNSSKFELVYFLF